MFRSRGSSSTCTANAAAAVKRETMNGPMVALLAKETARPAGRWGLPVQLLSTREGLGREGGFGARNAENSANRGAGLPCRARAVEGRVLQRVLREGTGADLG